VSPASGIRAAPGDFRSSAPPPRVIAAPKDEELFVRPPVDSLDFDFEAGRTQIGPPDASLLALARGELAKQAEAKQQAEADALRAEAEAQAEVAARAAAASVLAEKKPSGMRFGWFVLGLGVGGIIAWAASSDVGADVYRARLWAASTLRAVRGHVAGESAPVAARAPAVTASAAPTVPIAIPTIDVNQLPKARDEQGPPLEPPQAQGATPAPIRAPGAPALQQAPGPR
jgi:hypothetical protein